jgi:RNase P subunit RPR2
MADSYCVNAFELALISKEPVTEACDCCNALIVGWEFPRARLQADGVTFTCTKCDKNNQQND